MVRASLFILTAKHHGFFTEPLPTWYTEYTIQIIVFNFSKY